MPRRVVLVDGSWMIFRAFFAIPGNLVTKDGLHTNAILGFATMFRKLFAAKKPELGAVVFDGPGERAREKRYPAYKAQRPILPSELGEQLEWIKKLVDAHHFPQLVVPGVEADDVIGTLARQALESGCEVVIVSADKDFAQLVGANVNLLDTLRDVRYDAELVKKKWGVAPSQIVDLLALMGDASDNIPGVPGIGQKGAASLLEKFGSLDGIYEHIGELKGKQRQTLEENREVAKLSQELATIDQHVPLDRTIEDLAIVVPDPAELNALYKELEFYSLLTDVEMTDVGKAHDTASVRLADTPALVDEMLASFADKPVSVLPIRDPMHGVSAACAELVGLAFSLDGESSWYVHFPQNGGDLLVQLKPFFEDAARIKITHNVKELYQLLARRNVGLAGVVGDTMLASFVLEPTKLVPHKIDQLAKEYLQRTARPWKTVVGSGQKERRPSEIAPAEMAAYAGHLVQLTAQIWPILLVQLEQQKYLPHYQGHELPLAYVLGRMELDGIRADPQDLAAMGVEFTARKLAVEAKIHALAGHEFNIDSTRQLATVLFEELGLPVIKRNKTGYSTDSEVLERLAPKHEIANHVLEQRTLAKLINTYTDVLTKAVSPSTGRIHATLQQTVGASGRLISTDPDVQRTPVRTPEGRRIRKAFVAPEGRLLLSADWSQIELRVLAHFSHDVNLVDSFARSQDVHRRTASELFHVPLAEVTSAQRGVGKTVNFATIYGQGATALGQILGIPRKEAQTYIDHYFELYAGVRAWLTATQESALENQYVTTLLGRRRYIPELASHNEIDRQTGLRIAANTPIQGSAADLCKLAMLAIARRLDSEGLETRMLLQVHDELVFECPEREVERATLLVRECMERPYPLDVPLVVDVGVGRTWSDAH